MYADDTVLYVHAKNRQQAVNILIEVLVHVSDWLSNSDLHLNISKTVCMYFSQKLTVIPHPDVLVKGEKLKVVSDFKYLGVILDSKLTFQKNAKKVAKIIKFNLANFRHIRPCLIREAEQLFIHSIIFSHITYCFTSLSQASTTVLKSIESLYKQTLKYLIRGLIVIITAI